MQYISSSNFTKFLENLKNDYDVYIPIKKNDQYFYKKYIDFTDDIVISEVRAFEPLKSFFFRAREIVAENFKSDIPQKIQKPYCIVGVKACDLKGLQVQDYVFENHDYQDPFYINVRKNNLIISADCTSTIDTCFCLTLNVKPYPLENFDINLSVVREGFIFEVSSQKGQDLVEKYSFLFEEVKEEFISQRDKQREKVIKAVEENIKENNIPHQDSFKNIIERGYESNIWADEANNCVECGACNTICPTCHCFLLYDQKSENKMARLRIWDSCMIKDFAQVAGGANPRPELWMRLRNRFEKKFDFFPKVADIYACTGCGRCISACPAKIDIRKVLKRLVYDV
ncbi:4Fe-4S dicluster domain-containing protein [bacterium]|nr:4Fe-4S dicluster domain-containing protein [bacterium]MBU1428624.1 4Fe-4S dicluster domain-containing protein [bacterium]